MNLLSCIQDHIKVGSIECSLGVQSMPDGYTLMRNWDGGYYWICYDGRESVVSWDKWSAYRGAKRDNKE